MIQVDNMSFSYGEQAVLDCVDLYITEPGFYGVLGPNGSGKTTLLKLLCGILDNDLGVIKLDSIDIHQWNRKEIATHIAYVPQQFNMIYDFSVSEIVVMGRHPYHGRFESMSKSEKELVEHALDVTGLQKLKSKSITQLSGGEMQRVIIARALVQDTPVILLDEPISHLDIHYQKEIIHLLKKIAYSQNKIVISVLHDMNIGMNYCDQVYLINEGKIIAGKPSEVLTMDVIEEVYNTKVHMIKDDERQIVYW